MTFLPILERELRVRARSRANYWGRFAVAAVGVLVCAPPLLWSGQFVTPGTIGRGAFNCLVGTAFLLCCAACLLTADTISSERREGTLGLLLLTRVRHFDVLMGKFASSGLACLLGLVAFLPVLVLPLLTGGVTGGEVVRMAVALLNSLFLALSVGLWASARGFERFRTVRAAFLVMVGLVLGPGLLGVFMRSSYIGLLSPLAAIFQATDLAYKAAANRYWLSFGLVQIIGWTLLSTAMVSLRSRVSGSEDCAATAKQTDDNPKAVPPSIASDQPAGACLFPCRYCGRPNDADSVFCHECGMELHPMELRRRLTPNLSSAPTPLHWLLRRQHGLKPMVWVAAFIGFGHYALFGMLGRMIGVGWGMPFLGVSWGFGLVTTAITGALFAWVASRFFVEARRTGELELLLTTPIGAEQIVSTQWNVLQRLVRLPLAVMLVPMILQGLIMLSFSPGHPQSELWGIYYVLGLVLSAANTILGVFAVCWLGLWFGLRILGQGRVILWTVLLAKGFPYGLSMAWSLLFQPFIMRASAPGISVFRLPWLLGSLVPQLVTLLLYLWMVRIARWQLSHELTGAEPLDLRQILSRALPRITGAIQRARQWRAA